MLAYVYQLRAALAGQVAMPAALPELHVPADLDPHNKPVPDMEVFDCRRLGRPPRATNRRRFTLLIRLKFRPRPGTMDEHPNEGLRMNPLLQQWQRRLSSQHGEADARLEDFGWMMQELRVSLYAQELKTPVIVSVKRLEKILAGLN